MTKLKIRKDRTPAVLRKVAKEEPDARVSRRPLAIANAEFGMNCKLVRQHRHAFRLAEMIEASPNGSAAAAGLGNPGHALEGSDRGDLRRPATLLGSRTWVQRLGSGF